MSARDRSLALMVVALWGVNFVAIDLALRDFPPLFFVGLRFAVLAVPTLLFVKRPDVPWRWIVGYGAGFGIVQFAFLFVAMDTGMPAGLASIVLQACAPFTVVLGALLLRERISGRAVVGILVAVVGLALIAVHRAQTAALLPVLLTMVGALGWAFGNLSSRLARPEEPLRLVLWMSVIPPLPMLALSAVVEGPTAGPQAVVAALSGEAWAGVAGLLYVVVLATLVGSGAWTGLLKRHPASVVAPFSMLVPVVGVLAAWVLLGETPVPVEVAAGALVVGGVLFGTPRRPREPAVVEPAPAEPVTVRAAEDPVAEPVEAAPRPFAGAVR